MPRARVSAVAGRHGDALKIKIAAPPAEGAANAELIRFLADRLGLPRSAIRITAGHTSRRKSVTIAGMDAESAIRVLEGE